MIIQILSEPLEWSYHETSHEIVDLVFLTLYVLLAGRIETATLPPELWP